MRCESDLFLIWIVVVWIVVEFVYSGIDLFEYELECNDNGDVNVRFDD